MKKCLCLTTAILMAVMTFAQGSVKVTAKFSKGDYVIYEILSSIVQQSSMAGNDTASFVGEIKYEVKEEEVPAPAAETAPAERAAVSENARQKVHPEAGGNQHSQNTAGNLYAS